MYISTVNILKIRELFRLFNSYLSKCRSNFVLLRSRLAKIRAVLRYLKRSPPPFLGKNGRHRLFATVSCVLRGYHVYKEVWSPNMGEYFMCFAEEENIHDRKAVAVTCVEGFDEIRGFPKL